MAVELAKVDASSIYDFCGNRVRIDTQLIHATTDRHLWAKSYERDISDILALQNDVARAIVTEVRANLTPKDQLRLANAHSVDPEVYEAYLKGRYYSNKKTADGTSQGIGYFEHAIQKDPRYALAYAGLADAYNLLGFGVLAALPPKEAARRKVVGWALDRTLASRLTIAALERAIAWRRPRPGLVHHSDRGLQYASGGYVAVLEKYGIVPSMSRPSKSSSRSITIGSDCTRPWVIDLLRNSNNKASQEIQQTLQVQPWSLL